MNFKAGIRNILTVALIFPAITTIPVSAEDYVSPLALAADIDTDSLYVVEATAGKVVLFSLKDESVKSIMDFDNYLSGIALSPDGERLYVTERIPAGKVSVIDIESGRVIKSVPVGYWPTAPLVSPDGKILYVCNQFDNDVSVIDLASGTESARIGVGREPVTAALAEGGGLLFVGNHLPSGPADTGFISSSVSVVSTESRQLVGEISLPNGSINLRGMCVSPDGRYVYVVHILARYQVPTTQLTRGWMNTNAMSIIDVKSKELLNCVLLDDVDYGGANPWGVGCTEDGRFVCVTHAGTHEVSIIDREALHAKLEKVASGVKVSDVSLSVEDVRNDLSFMTGIRRRIKLSGKGPRGVAVIGSKVYICEYYSDSIGILDINSETGGGVHSVALGENERITPIRRGEINFHDASFCFQSWQSCASCHSDSGRSDALNWDLLNDGLGNPKNTKSLLYSHQSPPAMSLSVRDSTEAAVRAGITNIQFATYAEEDAEAIDEYMKSLRPLPSPRLVNGRLSSSAKRGKSVFKKAKCGKCHTGSLYTDKKSYNVGTGVGVDTGKSFDTPTLVEVWRTGPYLHDGRAGTMIEVLTKYNPDDKHGRTGKLTDEQTADLLEYILSL
jgi:YVTN family beta-propeller protein